MQTKFDFHIKDTPNFTEVKMGGHSPENCVTVEVTYLKNANPKGYYLDATLRTKGIDEYGSFYSDIYDFTVNRKKYALAKEAGRRGAKAEAEAIKMLNEKARLLAMAFGKELDEEVA